EVTAARASAQKATTLEQHAEAENVLTAALGRLFAVAEAYPQLRATENFQRLQSDLDETENKIAVARQLYNDAVLTYDTARETVPTSVVAGLFDLAARHLVELEEREPGSYVCRLETAPEEETLQPYERRVLELLRRRASGGIVPAGALTTGPSTESSKWWKEFRGEVVADAQSRG